MVTTRIFDKKQTIAARCRNKKTPLVVTINSSHSTAIFDCRIYIIGLTGQRTFISRQMSSSTWWNFI